MKPDGTADQIPPPYESQTTNGTTEVCRGVEESTQDGEDWLSALPDDILHCIFTRMVEIREIVKTSVLSKRWRHLASVCPSIVIDPGAFLPAGDNSMADLVRSNMAVVEATRSILAHRSQHVIDYLGISFFMRDEALDIVRSIEDVVANRKVVRLFVAFMAHDLTKEYTHDHKLGYGRRFMALFDECPGAFAALKGLDIQCARFSVSEISNVLKTCNMLEDLSLERCDSGVRSVLQVEHPQLIVLKIIRCDFEKVELSWLPCLEELTCTYWIPSKDEYPLSFGHVPQLWKLTLSNQGSTLHKTFVLSELLGNTALDVLVLDFMCRRIWIQPEVPKLLASSFQHLNVVRLHRIHDDCDLTWTMFFLQAACRLRKMYIEAWDHVHDDNEGEQTTFWKQIYAKDSDKKLLNWDPPNDFKHYHLRAISIRGFQVEERFMRYIRRIMEAAVNLEMISLRHSNMPCKGCQFYPSTSFPQSNEQRDRIREKISHQRSSPVKVEFTN